MPGISTTGVYQQVRRMTIPAANWTGAAVSGNAAYPGLNTLHGLTDGRNPTLPSWVAEQLDEVRAYVVFTSAAVYGDVESYVTFPSYTAAGNDRVQVAVSAALRDECYARFPNDPPLRLELRVLFKSPHSIEGRGPDDGENYPAAGTCTSLWSVPKGGATPGGTIEDVYVDPVAGNDNNDGHGAGAGRAWATMDRVRRYMEFVATFKNSLHVFCVPGPVGTWTAAASNFVPEGVTFVGGARFYVTGHAPMRDATNVNLDKRLTILVGPATINNPRDCDHLRMTPANGEIWMDNAAAPVNVVLDAADIGKTVRISDATHVAYATVSAVNGQGAAVANRWIEINANWTLLGAVPAWVSAVNTVWEILDPADPVNTQVTAMAGTWNLKGIRTTSGSALQAGAIPAKCNAIAHIRFTANQVVLEDCDRFSFPGCRFEHGIWWQFCRDCTTTSNAISDNLADRYYPDAIWTAQGYTNPGTNTAFGGMGFYAPMASTGGAIDTATVRASQSSGTVTGFVGTGGNAPNIGIFCAEHGSQIRLNWCSTGPDGANLTLVAATYGSAVGTLNARLCSQLRGSTNGCAIAFGTTSWLARAVNGADDAPVLATVATQVNAPLGLLNADSGGEAVLNDPAGTLIEGINLDNPTNVAVWIGRGCRFLAIGGHDVNFMGNFGWLYMCGSSTGYMIGNRTFSRRANGTAWCDVYVYNATLTTGPDDVWTKDHPADGGDQTLGSMIHINYHGNFKLGTPVPAAPVPGGRLVAGLPGVNVGFDAGAAGIVRVTAGSRATISDFRINNASNNPAIILTDASFLYHTGENVNSYVQRADAAANAIVNGSVTLAGYIPTGEAAHRTISSDYLAALGTAQGTYYHHE